VQGQQVAIEDYKLWGWCALENFGSFTFLVRLLVAVAKMGKCKNVRLGAWGWECLMFVLSFIFVVNGFLVTVCG
jgi:3-polyprenyl-4-hydroxybenzoate decarboxylase